MSSKFPNEFDAFKIKRDAKYDGDPNGDYVVADDINKIQTSIEAIQKTLGVNPQGESGTVSNRISSMGTSLLRVPHFLIYLGSATEINGATNSEASIVHYSRYKHVVLGKEFNEDRAYVIQQSKKISSTSFYGYIDCGSTTLNLTMAQVNTLINSWASAGVAGIYCDNFGYDYGVDRAKQNAILDAIHQKNLVAFINATNYEDVLLSNHHPALNPTSVKINLQQNDIYHVQKFAFNDNEGGRESLVQLIPKVRALNSIRETLKIKLFGTAFLSTQDDYDYTHAVALLCSLDGFQAAQPDYGFITRRGFVFNQSSLNGEWYHINPVISVRDNGADRETPFGKITVANSGVFSFEGIFLPIESLSQTSDVLHGKVMIDRSITSAKIADYDGSRIIDAINIQEDKFVKINFAGVTDIPTDILKTNIIEAINLYSGTATINQAKIGELDASKITAGTIDAERISSSIMEALEANIGYATINSALIGHLAAEHIEAAVIDAIRLNAEEAWITNAMIRNLNADKITAGDIDADRIRTNVVSAINAYAENLEAGMARIDAAAIQDLNADKITAGTIDAERIMSSVIHAINMYAGTIDAGSATINSAVIGALQSKHIQTIVIEAINANIDAINAGSAKINSGAISVLSSDHMQVAVLSAINASVEELDGKRITIDSGKIGELEASNIKAGAITTEKLDADAVTAEKIKADEITSKHLATDAVTAKAIEADAVTAGKIDALAISARELQVDSVVSDKIKADAIIAEKIAADAITAEKIAADAVTAEKILAGAVSTDKLDALAVTAEKIAADAITAEKIQADQIDTGHIKANAIQADQIGADAVTAVKIAADAVLARNIKAGEINANHIKAGEINANHIAAGTITANHIQGDSAKIARIISGNIQSNDIAALQITSNHIQAKAINTGHIATEGLDARVITSGYINSDVIDVRSIRGQQLNFDTITSWEISSNAVAARHMQAESISGEAIRAGTITAEHISTGGLDANSMFVYGADGETIIGGGYLRVDGMDVGVIQSDNLVTNGNFNIYSDKYGYYQENIPGKTILGLETAQVGSHEVWAYDMVGTSKQSMSNGQGQWSVQSDPLASGHYRVLVTFVDQSHAVVDAQDFYFEVDTENGSDTTINPNDFTSIKENQPSFNGITGAFYGIDFRIYRIKRFSTGKKPAKIVQQFNPSIPKNILYISSQGEDSITVIDLLTERTIKKIRTGSEPVSLALSNDQTKLFVINSDLSDRSEPDHMTIINTNTLEIEKEVVIGTTPSNIYVSKVNPVIYIVSSRDADVYIYDLISEKITGAISVGDPLGKFSYGIAFNPDESRMFVSNTLRNEIVVVDMATREIVHTIKTGDSPSDIQMHPNGMFLYVLASGINSIEIYEMLTYSQVLSERVGGLPVSMGIYPNPLKPGQHLLYINASAQNQTVVIDLETNELAGILRTGQNPFGMAMHPYGIEFYVANHGDSSFVSFTYPEGGFIGDAYMDDQQEQGRATYNGAAGWAPRRRERLYDASGNPIGAASVEFHTNEQFHNQNGYAKLSVMGVGNQYAQIEQDVDLVVNHSNGLPLNITEDECVLTSHLTYKSSNRHWVVGAPRLVHMVMPNLTEQGELIFLQNGSPSLSIVEVDPTQYVVDHEDGVVTFKEEGHPGYLRILNQIINKEDYVYVRSTKKITLVGEVNVKQENLTKILFLLNAYAVPENQYLVDHQESSITFNQEVKFIDYITDTWPKIVAHYSYHSNVWFNDYNASAMIMWDRPVPAEQKMAMEVEEFVPKFVVMDSIQLTPFTPIKDNIQTEYKGLTYSGQTNVTARLPQEKIMILDNGVPSSHLYNYGLDTVKDMSRIVDGKRNNKFFQTDGQVSTVILDLSNEEENKLAYIMNGARIVHYHQEGWKYLHNVIEVSADGQQWISLYDAAIYGAYMETEHGVAIVYDQNAQGPYSRLDTGHLVIPIPNQIPVRFIRNTIGNPVDSFNSPLANPSNRWVSMEVYGDWWYTQEYKYQASQLGTDAGAKLGLTGKTTINQGPHAVLISDPLQDENLQFLSNHVKDLRLIVGIQGAAVPIELALVQREDYSSSGPLTYDVLAQAIEGNINAIVYNQNLINDMGLPYVSVTHSNGRLMIAFLNAALIPGFVVSVLSQVPMTLSPSGFLAKTNISGAFVEAEIALDYTSRWHATFLRGLEMGMATILVDEQIDGKMPETWFPPYLVLADFVTRNGYYTGNKLRPGKHRVRFQQSAGTVVFDRFRFEDYQSNGKTFLDLAPSDAENSWKRYKVNSRRNQNYVGKGKQTTYGPFDEIRISPVTGLPDASCEIKYRIIFKTEMAQSPTPSIGNMYVTGVVFEKGKLSTHWRKSESSDIITSKEIQQWEPTRPTATGIQERHLADGIVGKHKLRTHIIEDFHVSPFAQISEYKLDLNYPTHPHQNKATLDQISGWGDTGISTNMARADHDHNSAYAPLSHVGTGGGSHAVVTTTLNGFMIAADKVKLNGIAVGATLVASSATNGNIQINGVQTTVYTHPNTDGSLHVPATSTTNNGRYLRAGSTAGSLAWTQVDFSHLSGGITDTQHGNRGGGTLHSLATTTTHGFMDFSDKVKLNGISTGAKNTTNHINNGSISVDGIEQVVYTHPAGAGNNHIPSGGAANQYLKYSASGVAVWATTNFTDIAGTITDTQHGNRGGAALHAAVTTTVNGFMIAADKLKLDAIEANAINQITADGRYLRLTGGTLLGSILVSSDNVVIGADTGSMRLGIYKKQGFAPVMAYASGLSFDVYESAGADLKTDISTTNMSLILRTSNTTFTYKGNNVWHAGNFTPSSKSDVGHIHTVANISDIRTNYYIKSEVDTLIANAGDIRAGNNNTFTGLNSFTRSGLAIRIQPSVQPPTPTTLFSINRADGNSLFTVDSNGKLLVEGDFEITGQTITKSTQDIQGDMNVTGNISVTGDTILGDDPSDQTTINGTLRVIGDIQPIGKHLEVARFPVYGIGGDLQFQSASTSFEKIIGHYWTFNSTNEGSALPPVGSGTERKYRIMVAYSTRGASSSAQFRVVNQSTQASLVDFTLPAVQGAEDGTVRHFMSPYFTTNHAGHTDFLAQSAGENRDLIIKYIEVVAYDYYA